MPRKLSALSLCEISVLRIVEDFETITFGCNRNFQNFNELNASGAYLDSERSLIYLPTNLLNILADRLIDTRGLKPYVIRNIMISTLTECHLLPQISSLPLALQTIEKHCRKLKVFQLTCCKNIEVKLITSVLKVSSCLHTLNLEGTSVDDDCLESISESNRTLVALNLARTKITNRGADCVKPHAFPCLHFLIILGTAVTADRVIKLLRLRSLLSLEFDYMLQVLLAMEEETSTLLKLSISNVLDTDAPRLAQNLRNFTNLTALSFQYSVLGLRVITSLSSMGTITKLELGAKQSSSFNLLSNYLQSQGGRLTHLSLENYTDCDLHLIGNLCPVMTVLKISQCKFESSSYSSKFPYLEEFLLFNTPDSHFPESFLNSVLSAEHISVLYLQNADSLCDRSIERCIQSHGLKNLASLSIENCHRIGLNGVVKLVNQENMLQSLHIWSCVQITEIQQLIIQQIIDMYMLDLNFQWQGGPIQLDYENPDQLRDLLLPLLGVRIIQDL